MVKSTFPKDRFDDIPDDLERVGAHRAQNIARRGWIWFAWAALATGILVISGVVGLGVISQTADFSLPVIGGQDAPRPSVSSSFAPSASPSTAPSASPSASASPSSTTPAAVTPQLDRAVLITVLNGTRRAGLANAAGDALVQKGWGGAAIGVGARATAERQNVTATVVYYTSAASRAAALKVVEDLGIGTAQLSQAYPATPIAVLLGADFVLPAG